MHALATFFRSLVPAIPVSIDSRLGRVLVVMPLVVGLSGAGAVAASISGPATPAAAGSAAHPQDISLATSLRSLLAGSSGAGGVASTGAAPSGRALLRGKPASAPPAVAAKPAAPAKPAPAKAAAAKAAPAKPAVAKRAAVKPASRWLPSGAGAWIYGWSQTDGGNARTIVAHARAVGVSTLYVRTGSSAGFIGGSILDQLLPATAGTPVSVVAWDFPTLRDPVADAKRLAAAALHTVPGAPRVRAVAPDIETPAEGTYLHAKPLQTYLVTLRKLLPPNVSILSTVPWPSEARSHYPYWLVAPYSDALVPMAYWYNRSPASVTAASIDRLRAYHKPVIPAGQGFDPRIDAPYLSGWNPGPELAAFLDTAKARGVPAVSLWSWQTLGPSGWHALSLASKMFAKH